LISAACGTSGLADLCERQKEHQDSDNTGECHHRLRLFAAHRRRHALRRSGLYLLPLDLRFHTPDRQHRIVTGIGHSLLQRGLAASAPVRSERLVEIIQLCVNAYAQVTDACSLRGVIGHEKLEAAQVNVNHGTSRKIRFEILGAAGQQKTALSGPRVAQRTDGVAQLGERVAGAANGLELCDDGRNFAERDQPVHRDHDEEHRGGEGDRIVARPDP
jgi:hypothetical protein